MPIYNYKCAEGHKYTELESIKAERQTVCREPDCGAPVTLDYSKLTGVRAMWRGGPPTPKFGR
jgi:predicted nucleic acid-binding Zn ribbon protein